MLLTLVQSTFTVLLTSEINREKGDKNRVKSHSFRVCDILRSFLWCWKFVLYKMAEMRLLQGHGTWKGVGEDARKNNVQAWRSRNGHAQAYYCHMHWNTQLRVRALCEQCRSFLENSSSKKTVKCNNTKCLNSLHNYLRIAMQMNRPGLLLPCQEVHMGIDGRMLFSSEFVYFT